MDSKQKCVSKKNKREVGESLLFYLHYIKKGDAYILNNNYGIFKSLTFINESNINIFNKLDTPELIFKWMKNNIKYDNSSYDWKLKSPEEVYNKKIGNCHDQARFISKALSNIGVEHGTLFFIEYNDNENVGGRTHSLVWFKNKDKIYWLENAWFDQKGIHGPYNSVKDLKKYIEDIHSKEPQFEKYPLIEWSTVKNIKTGMNLQDYVNSCLNNI